MHNRFWSNRKSTGDKTVRSLKIKDCENNADNKKQDRSGFAVFSKFRKSFVKAKSFDSDSSNKKSNSNTKETNKKSRLSLRRMFSKSLNISAGRDVQCVKLDNSNVVDDGYKASLKMEVNDGECYHSVQSMNSNSKYKCGHQKLDPVVKGITNTGNTCYINSVIQCLNVIDQIAKYFVFDEFISQLKQSKKQPDSAEFSLLFKFAKFLRSLWISDLDSNLLSNEFRFELGQTERIFQSNDQQDAQEFLLFILNYCHEHLKTTNAVVNEPSKKSSGKSSRSKNALFYEAQKIINQNTSRIHSIFATYQQLTIVCPNCRTRQHKLEPNLCLSLPVPAKTMEPLCYCFVEKDGSQIFAAMWINTVSPVQFVRANIAHKFRLHANDILLMVVTESGFGKFFQDSDVAVELLSFESTQSTTSNIWNGVVALEISAINNNNSFGQETVDCDPDSLSMHQMSIKQMKNTNLPFNRVTSDHTNDIRRRSGHYDNLSLDTEKCAAFTSQTDAENDSYQSSNLSINKSHSNNGGDPSEIKVNLVVIHIEEITENSFVSCWRRFSAPIAISVQKEIEFRDLQKLILSQLELVYQCSIQTRLKSNLKFWIWDGLKNIDLEITSDHQFPLLTEPVESIISWSDNIATIRIAAVWSPSNAARLMQTVFSNFRLSHSLGRTGSKNDIYSSRSQSLSLLDAWSTIEENGSVELVLRESLAKRKEYQDCRNISLEDCLKAYLSEEVLDAKDAWKCPNCRTFQRAKMSNSIYILPEVLVLHLKRFQSYSLSFNSSYTRSLKDHDERVLATVGGNSNTNRNGFFLCENNSNNKLNILVDYPVSGLDLRPYLSNDIEQTDKKEDLYKSNSAEYFYDLIAVCNHQGTLSTGHYTAFCRSSVDYKWRLFNDDFVKEISAGKVVQPNAYILFYQRRSTILSHDNHWSISLDIMEIDASRSSTPINDRMSHENLRKTDHNRANSNTILTVVADDMSSLFQPTASINSICKNNIPKDDHPISTCIQQSALRRPLPLDLSCTSLRNITPILRDSTDDDSNIVGDYSSSPRYRTYIPSSVSSRPLKFDRKSP